MDDIEVALGLDSLSQLFEPLDPSPFGTKDLDARIEAYVVDWVRELPARARLTIVLEVPPAVASDPRASEVQAAIRGYFAGRAERLRHDMRELFREGRRALVIGMPLLAACVLTSKVVRPDVGGSTLAHVVSESLLILGWVANWRPIEIFLYAWWPIYRRIEIYRRLAVARIEVRVREAVAPAPAPDPAPVDRRGSNA